jgi:hypothetical protein
VRATAHRLGLPLERRLARLVEALDLEIALGVAVDDGVEPAMLRADPGKYDPSAAL